MANATTESSRASRWAGLIISGLVSMFLLVDAGMKVVKAAPVIDAMTKLGFPESSIVGMGLALLASTILYLIPRTAPLGAILLTGYLGGAVATHVRVSAPAFNIVFAVTCGVLAWLGIWLRDPRLRQSLPIA